MKTNGKAKKGYTLFLCNGDREPHSTMTFKTRDEMLVVWWAMACLPKPEFANYTNGDGYNNNFNIEFCTQEKFLKLPTAFKWKIRAYASNQINTILRGCLLDDIVDAAIKYDQNEITSDKFEAIAAETLETIAEDRKMRARPWKYLRA